MKMEDMKVGMRVTFTPPSAPHLKFHGQVGQVLDTGEKIVQFEDGKTFFLNDQAAQNFEPILLN